MSKKKDTMRVNRAIRAREIRVIDSQGEQAGILRTEEALSIAESEGLDLVEISPNANPPVCKIMNYGKYKFQQAKKIKDAKANQKQVQVKEVKFKPRIDEHDYQFKCKHIRRFIDHGDKVRVFVHFRGREMMHRDLGLKILNRIIDDMGEMIIIEKRPSMEGRHMAMYLIGNDTVVKSKPKKPDEPEAAEATLEIKKEVE